MPNLPFYSQAHVPIHLTLSNYAHSATQPPPTINAQGRSGRRLNMRQRSSNRGGGAYVSSLDKCEQDAAGESKDPDDKPRAGAWADAVAASPGENIGLRGSGSRTSP